MSEGLPLTEGDDVVVEVLLLVKECVILNVLDTTATLLVLETDEVAEVVVLQKGVIDVEVLELVVPNVDIVLEDVPIRDKVAFDAFVSETGPIDMLNVFSPVSVMQSTGS